MMPARAHMICRSSHLLGVSHPLTDDEFHAIRMQVTGGTLSGSHDDHLRYGKSEHVLNVCIACKIDETTGLIVGDYKISITAHDPQGKTVPVEVQPSWVLGVTSLKSNDTTEDGVADRVEHEVMVLTHKEYKSEAEECIKQFY